jgi:hypothetical protein
MLIPFRRVFRLTHNHSGHLPEFLFASTMRFDVAEWARNCEFAGINVPAHQVADFVF